MVTRWVQSRCGSISLCIRKIKRLPICVKKIHLSDTYIRFRDTYNCVWVPEILTWHSSDHHRLVPKGVRQVRARHFRGEEHSCDPIYTARSGKTTSLHTFSIGVGHFGSWIHEPTICAVSKLTRICISWSRGRQGKRHCDWCARNYSWAIKHKQPIMEVMRLLRAISLINWKTASQRVPML